jgi:hypothetical protein
VINRSVLESIQQFSRTNLRGLANQRGGLNQLSLSGAGSNGAAGAGLLRGWTGTGDGPAFKPV